jgi:putative hydrolase of the HAD superfamily
MVMKRYDAYTFDLWLTLIKSNPLYKEYRSHIFYKEFNPLDYNFDEVKFLIREVDIMCNRINEIAGKNIDSREIICLVLEKLGNDLNTIDIQRIESVESRMEELFFKYHPVLYDNDTKTTLKILHARNAFIGLISNTGFIKGKTLTKMLEILEIDKYFHVKIFSDEVGFSKPNPLIFKEFIKKLNPAFYPLNILHVGDNPIADVKGAQYVGIDAYQINSNEHTIKDLLT